MDSASTKLLKKIERLARDRTPAEEFRILSECYTWGAGATIFTQPSGRESVQTVECGETELTARCFDFWQRHNPLRNRYCVICLNFGGTVADPDFLYRQQVPSKQEREGFRTDLLRKYFGPANIEPPPSLARRSQMEEILGGKIEVELVMPGTRADSEYTVLYIREGEDPFKDWFFQKVTRHVHPPIPTGGGVMMENCRIVTPSNAAYQAIAYRLQPDAWHEQIAQGARAFGSVIGNISNDNLVVPENREVFSLFDCRIEFFGFRKTAKNKRTK